MSAQMQEVIQDRLYPKNKTSSYQMPCQGKAQNEKFELVEAKKDREKKSADLLMKDEYYANGLKTNFQSGSFERGEERENAELPNKTILKECGNNEEEYDEENENFDNFFGEALKNLKQKINWCQQNSQIDANQSNYLSQMLEFSIMDAQKDSNKIDNTVLKKFNYVSLLLDDIGDKNTSLNTKALAQKYLKDANYISNSNFESFSSNYSTSINQPLFQYYDDEKESNSFQNTEKTQDNHVTYLKTIQDNLFIPEESKNNTIKNNSYTNQHKTSSAMNFNSSKEKIGYTLISNEQLHEKNKKAKEKLEEQFKYDDEDDEIWVFKKPEPKKANFTQSKERPEVNFNERKFRLQNVDKRLMKQKNFSDEDEDPDRDVTTILDIEKLKRLPKLL